MAPRYGILSIPIRPTKLFVAVNDAGILDKLRRASPAEIAAQVNIHVATRARRFVWAQDRSQQALIDSRKGSTRGPQ